MPVKTFAAIDVGSFELSMKIFEFSGRNAMREIDQIRRKLDFGSETYAKGKIGNEKLDELCRVLKEFSGIMKAYKVEAYQAYGTSAIREAQNKVILMDQIRIRTGIRMEVLSNSEQRFLGYKSVASKGEVFRKIIEEKTAIVDIGGGSIQLSLFDNDTLVSTQNLRLGVLRIQERLNRLNAKSAQMESLIDEMVSLSLVAYQKLYLKEREIRNLIIVDDYISLAAVRRAGKDAAKTMASAQEWEQFMELMRTKSFGEIAKEMDLAQEKVILLFISGVLMRRLILLTGAQYVWVPGVTLCDGIAYDYGEKKKLLRGEHNFEKDIIACAMNISKRYLGSRKQAEVLENITMTIFDGTKKMHGLGKRERLYLQIAALLQDCGKYISLVNEGEDAYNIIMATEIIGLSHRERELVANTVRYHFEAFAYDTRIGNSGYSLDQESYLLVAKLTALLRLANCFYRSRRQKFKQISAVLRDGQLFLTVETMEDITLEKGLFEERAEFFREVFSVQPVLKQKKKL